MWGLLVLALLVVSVVVVIVLVKSRSQDPTRRPTRERLDGWTPPPSSGSSGTAVADLETGQGPAAPGRAHAGAPGGEAMPADDAPAPMPAGTSRPASDRAEPPPGRPLPELLRGMAWPCSLTPHVAPDQPDTDHYLALVTTEASGPAVAAALTQELERLGYEVMALSEDDLVARRDDDLLSGRVHERAEAANVGGRQLFPTAAPSAVAVELWGGGGPNPRTT